MLQGSLARSAAQVVPLLLLSLLSLLTVVWWAPGMPYPEQDSAWVLAINQAVADRLTFGRDVLFTLGPWGNVYAGQYHPATDGMMLAGGIIVALALTAGLAVAAPGGRRWWTLLAPLLVATVGQHDPVFVTLPLLLVAVAVAPSHPARGRDAALLILVVACALLSFIKGTFGTQAVPMVALAVLALATQRRLGLAGLLLGAYTVAIVAFWVWAGQPLADLPGYARSMPVVISGYAEGLALGGPLSDIAAYLFAGATLCWLLWRSQPLAGRAVDGAVLMLGLLLTLFVAFKSGFVRNDAHKLIAVGSLGMMPLALAGALRPRALAAALLVTWSALTFVSQHLPFYQWPSASAAQQRFTLAANGLWNRWSDPGLLPRLYEKHMTAARLALPLPHVAGPTDIYSSGQMSLLANGLQWSPRPALQSVTVFSEALAQADLDHLEGRAGRPPVLNVFYRVENEDNRLHATQDGLSWPALLSRFRVASFDRGQQTALFQRIPGATATTPGSPALLDADMPVGEAVALPTSPTGLAWATIDLRPTVAGRIAALLFRPPVLTITLRYANGAVEHARLVSGIAGAGFLLGPRVASTEDMLWWLLPDRRVSGRPVSLAVTGEAGTSWLWQDRFTLRLQPIDIPVQEQVRAMVQPAPLLPAQAPAAKGLAEACAIELVDGRPPSAAPVGVRGVVEISGWSVVKVAGGEAPDRVVLRLADGAGRAWEAVAEPRARLDIAGYFGDLSLSTAGFAARFDLSGLQGEYVVTVLAERGGALWRCQTTQRLMVQPASGVPG